MSDQVIDTTEPGDDGDGDDAPPRPKTRRVFDGRRWIVVPEQNAAHWDERAWHADAQRDGRR